MTGAARTPPDDAALPHLGELTEPDSALLAAVRELGGADAGDSPTLRHVRYRPGLDCVAAWEVRGPAGTGLVSARVFRDDRAATVVESEQFRGLVARLDGGPHHRRLDSHHALLQRVPLDNRLPGLIDAVSAEWYRDRTAGSSADHVLTDVVSVEPLAGSYKPCVRAVLALHDPAGQPIAFAKVHRAVDAAPPVAVQRELHRRLSSGDSGWQVGRPLAHFAREAVVVVEATPGEALDQRLDAARNDAVRARGLAESCRAAASGLVAVQASGVVAPAVITPSSLVEGLQRRCRRMTSVEPELGSRFSAAVDRLGRAAAAMSAEDLVLSHGAFRIEHVLDDGERLVAIDLDNLRMSGSGADAGSFLGHLDHLVAVDPLLRGPAEIVADGFDAGLTRSRADAGHWIDWYRIESQLKWGLRSFFSLVPGWRDVCGRSLDSIERALGTPVEAAAVS